MRTMQFELILTVSIVNFGFKCVQSHLLEENKAVTNEVSDEGRIRENFQNLFDSMAKNDGRKTELFREALKEEASKGQQAYDEINDEIRFARIRNSHKKMNIYTKNKISGNIIAFKRAATHPYEYYNLQNPYADRMPEDEYRRGCNVENGKYFVKAGESSIDADRCVVWHCTHSLELEDYGCKEIEKDQERFKVFWAQCYAIDCFR